MPDVYHLILFSQNRVRQWGKQNNAYPPDVHILIFKACDYVTLYGRDLEYVIKDLERRLS